MKSKLGNSTKKLIKIAEEKKKELESSNHHESVKIKSLANMFEGKIGTNPMQKNPENVERGEKLNKLYGGNVEYEKEIEVEVDNDDENDNNKIKKIVNSNLGQAMRISVKRRITVTKMASDVNQLQPCTCENDNKDNFILEESKPRTMTHVKKFKKPNFKLDK